jgi:hypothetical protein
MTALAAPARFNFGRTISRTFGAVGGNFVTFLLLALLLSAAPAIAIAVGVDTIAGLLAQGNSSSFLAISGLLNFVGALFSMIPAYILVGAITHGTIVHYDGGRASFGECLSTGSKFVLPLTGLGILTLLGLFLWALPIFVFSGIAAGGAFGFYNPFLVLFGVFVLAVPAVLAIIRWSVAAPALVMEKTGVLGAFRRSGDLTRDNRWAIFFLVLVITLIVGVILLALTFVGAVAMTSLGSAAVIGFGYYTMYAANLLFSIIISMLYAAGVAALYYELRTAKEGATSSELAKVFD